MVMAVSALDHYIHEIVRLGMLEIYLKKRPDTHAFKRFFTSLKSPPKGITTPTKHSWFDNEIMIHHSWKSFQQPDKIAETIRLISDVKLWEEVADYMGKTTRNVKQQLGLIVDRRNKIAHEADIDPTFSDGSRWPIDVALVDGVIDFIEEVAEVIYKVI